MKNLCQKILVSCVGVLLCLCGFFLVGCGGLEQKHCSSYVLDLFYDEKVETLHGKERVEYVNTSENAFSQLYFHLYPNAFKDGNERLVVSKNKEVDAYYNGLSYGEIVIESAAYQDGTAANFEVGGEKENILIVCLQEDLYPEEKTIIEIEFSVKLATINHRLGVGENTINFGNFYPVACVYEEGKGFKQDLYHSNGDPFYSEVANYCVSLNFSSDFTLANSGEVVSCQEREGRVQAQIEAENVRDFFFTLSPIFEKASCQNDGVTINYFGYKEDKDLEENLQTCTKALSFFNEKFGKYPYKQLSVVKASFLNGGMEYPNIVLVSDTVEVADYAYVIVHEIAHQWWYGVVGNDQYAHAWLDEALAEYSTLMFFREHSEYGEDFEQMIDAAEKSYKLFSKIYKKVNGIVDGVMDKPLCDFETEPEYVQCTYTKGALMLHSIEESVGQTKFLKSLRRYFEQFKYKIATPADFIAVFIKTCGTELEGYINSWLYDKIVIGE